MTTALFLTQHVALPVHSSSKVTGDFQNLDILIKWF